MTLGFGEIIPQVVRNGDNVVGFDLTHGTLRDQPDRLAGLRRASASRSGLPLSFQQSFDRAQWFYWTALALLLITVFCSVRLRDSRLGRAWIAIREDETAAAAMGIPLMRTKTWAYALGAFFGGVAGAFYATLQERRVPERLLLQHLRLPALHGHPRRDGLVWGVVLGGHDPRLPRTEGLAKIGNWVSENVSGRARRRSTRRSTSSASTA